jgi:hypothetical protein
MPPHRHLVHRGIVVGAFALSMALVPVAGTAQDAEEQPPPVPRVQVRDSGAPLAPPRERPLEERLDGDERDAEADADETTRDRMVLTLSPQVTSVGAPVQALVRLAPNAENRLLRLMVDSGDYFRSSDVQLDGEDAASAHFLPLVGLPEGRYQLLAVLYDARGEVARGTQTLHLVSTVARPNPD